MPYSFSSTLLQLSDATSTLLLVCQLVIYLMFLFIIQHLVTQYQFPTYLYDRKFHSHPRRIRGFGVKEEER